MERRNARATIRVAFGWLARGIGAVVAVLVLYLAAGLIGGLIPVNFGQAAPARGITVYVESNGIHTGIVVPKVAAGVDWRPLARPWHLRDPRYAAFDHLAFGWGERAFYIGTPTWADVKVGTVIAAALGSDRTLVHVDHLPRPAPGHDVRAVVLTPAAYRRLAAFIRASFAERAAVQYGYGRNDAFYAARGRYSALRTCNAWTGAALAQAGVRVGWWTPFPATVMWWL